MPTINQYNKKLRYYVAKGMKLAFRRHSVNRIPTKEEIEAVVIRCKQKIWLNPAIADKVKDYAYRAGRNAAINMIKRGNTMLNENNFYSLRSFENKDNRKELVEHLLNYLISEWNINKPFIINFVDDKLNEQNDLGKTGFYNTNTSDIFVYTSGRHFKDVLRTIAHEVYHHKQFCEGKFDNLFESELDQKSIYDDIEEDAYRFGNKTFRIWEDKYKSGAFKEMDKTKTLDQLKEELINKLSTELVREASEKDTPTRSTGINKLITALKVVLPSVESAYKSLTTDKEQRVSFKKAYLMALLATLAPQNVVGKYSSSDGDVSPVKLAERLNVKFPKSAPPVIEDTPENTEDDPAVEDIAGNKYVKDPSKLIDPNDPNGEKKKKEEEKAAKKGKKAPEDELDKIVSVDDQELDFPEEEGMDPTGRFEAVEVYKKTIDAIVRAYRRLANGKDKNDFQNELITQLLLWFDKWEYDISPDVPDLSTDDYEKSKDQVKQFSQPGGGLGGGMPNLAETKTPVKPKTLDEQILEALKQKNIL